MTIPSTEQELKQSITDLFATKVKNISDTNSFLNKDFTCNSVSYIHEYFHLTFTQNIDLVMTHDTNKIVFNYVIYNNNVLKSKCVIKINILINDINIYDEIKNTLCNEEESILLKTFFRIAQSSIALYTMKKEYGIDTSFSFQKFQNYAETLK